MRELVLRANQRVHKRRKMHAPLSLHRLRGML